MVVQVRFFQALWHPYIAWEGVWLNCYWSPSFEVGRNPRVNWNVDFSEQPLDVNVRITQFGPLNAFDYGCLIQDTDVPRHDALFSFATPQSWIEWEQYVAAVQFWPNTQEPENRRVVADDFLAVRIGTYERIPADTCEVL